MKNKDKSKERIKVEKKENLNRSDFKVYQFGRDDGRGKLESQRQECVVNRLIKNQKWKPQ